MPPRCNGGAHCPPPRLPRPAHRALTRPLHCRLRPGPHWSQLPVFPPDTGLQPGPAAGPLPMLSPTSRGARLAPMDPTSQLEGHPLIFLRPPRSSAWLPSSELPGLPWLLCPVARCPPVLCRMPPVLAPLRAAQGEALCVSLRPSCPAEEGHQHEDSGRGAVSPEPAGLVLAPRGGLGRAEPRWAGLLAQGLSWAAGAGSQAAAALGCVPEEVP